MGVGWDGDSPTATRRSPGIPAPPLHARPRPSRVSQTPRRCQRRRQETRAACVMGAGNKDAQDPVPWLPRTNRPDLPGLLPRASRAAPHTSRVFLEPSEPECGAQCCAQPELGAPQHR